MDFSIIPTHSRDLPLILELNEKSLPAVSGVTLDEMAYFLNIADYFRTLKIGKNNWWIFNRPYSR